MGRISSMPALAVREVTMRRMGTWQVLARQYATQKEKVVVLGCGWAGFRFIKDLDKDNYDVYVVSPRNHFLFTPMLASTTVGTIEFRSILEPVRTETSKKGFHYINAECVDIDEDSGKIRCKSAIADSAGKEGKEFDVPFHHLVVSVGCLPNTFGVPGVEENAFFLKEVGDAQKIRQRIIEVLELARMPSVTDEELKRLLHFVIVGGGPTGVEFAGELGDFIRTDMQKLFKNLPRNSAKVTLFQSTDKILAMFDKNLSEKAVRQFEKSHIVDVRTNCQVESIDKEKITLKGGEEIPYGLCVWSTGIGPRPLLRHLQQKQGYEMARGTRLVVDDHLRVKGRKNVYALGDCAAMESQPDIPATAQAAQQQGKFLAAEFNAMAGGSEIKPFRFNNLGMMAYVGGYVSLFDTPQLKMAGLTAWFAWRSVYLTKLGSIKNKFQVPFDWTKTLLFGRDVTLFTKSKAS